MLKCLATSIGNTDKHAFPLANSELPPSVSNSKGKGGLSRDEDPNLGFTYAILRHSLGDEGRVGPDHLQKEMMFRYSRIGQNI